MVLTLGIIEYPQYFLNYCLFVIKDYYIIFVTPKLFSVNKLSKLSFILINFHTVACRWFLSVFCQVSWLTFFHFITHSFQVKNIPWLKELQCRRISTVINSPSLIMLCWIFMSLLYVITLGCSSEILSWRCQRKALTLSLWRNCILCWHVNFVMSGIYFCIFWRRESLKLEITLVEGWCYLLGALHLLYDSCGCFYWMQFEVFWSEEGFCGFDPCW